MADRLLLEEINHHEAPGHTRRIECDTVQHFEIITNWDRPDLHRVSVLTPCSGPYCGARVDKAYQDRAQLRTAAEKYLEVAVQGNAHERLTARKALRAAIERSQEML